MNWTLLLSTYFEKAGATFKKSLIRYLHAVLGIFVRRPFEQGMVVGYYYGTLIYIDLCRRLNTMLTYGKQSMQAPRGKFQIWANHILEKVLDRDIVEHEVCIVPV